jgi:hypothetical protein
MKPLSTLFSLSLLLGAQTAHAQFITGDTWYGHSHYAGTQPIPIGGIASKIVITDAGPDYQANSGFGSWTVDLVGNKLVFNFPVDWTFNMAGGGTPTSFNGFWLSDFNSEHPDFMGVSLDSTSTLSPTQVDWGPGYIFMDFEGLHVVPGDRVILVATIVPEMPTWALTFAGLGILVTVRRRGLRLLEDAAATRRDAA